MPNFSPRSILEDLNMDDEFMEVFDRYKERELDPAEMDLKIQADRVIYVINRCLAKLYILAHLPFLLKNDAELLRKYMKPMEVLFVLELLNSWGTNFNTSRYEKTFEYYEYLKEIDPKNGNYIPLSTKQSDTTLRPSAAPKDAFEATDPYIANMIDLLFYNKCLQPVIKTAKNPRVDRNIMSIIKQFQELREIAKKTLYVTGDEEEALDKELRRAFKSNDLLTAIIDDLKEELEKQRKELGDQLNEKVKIFEMYHEKMENIKEDFQQQYSNILHESEKIMMHKSNESEIRQAELAEDAKKLIAQYETLLDDHLNQEKISRSKRFKAETQLQNWLTKFDQDIGDKQGQYEKLKQEYDEKKAETEKLEELLEEQEDEYISLMEEKRMEEERIYNEMAYHLLINRAARKIQRYWRAYRERRAKRKGKKGKGGKKSGFEFKAPRIIVTRTSDPNVALGTDKKIKQHVFESLSNPNFEVFTKKESTPIF
ncbi:unnamed protein product [Phaedon cochleariae]|uniref:Dynein regulatory complex protein 10 n=1 Tax=Phaedon cochleariae TaxID=80249 RepID=A0A9P0DHD8_PHACE|nr:unnamed protein product [Phaedon cochleariae]